MTIRHIYIDSRSRYLGIPASCQFLLNRTLHNVDVIQVRSFTFANTIYNIDEYNNQLVFVIGIDTKYTITIPPKFYTAQEFVDKLNMVIRDVTGFDTNAVSLRNNTLMWTIGPTRIQGGSMSDVIGQFFPTMTGTFETPLTLSSPAAIAVTCKEVQSHAEHITTSKLHTAYTPLLLSSLTRGYGNLEVYEPQTVYAENFNMHATDRLSFSITDPRTGRVLDEITAWSMIIRVHSK